MESVVLPSELERFVAEAVADGRYRSAADVVAAGVGLLRDAESDVAAFARSLETARAEAERDGWVSLDDVLADMDRIIAESAHGGA